MLIVVTMLQLKCLVCFITPKSFVAIPLQHCVSSDYNPLNVITVITPGSTTLSVYLASCPVSGLTLAVSWPIFTTQICNLYSTNCWTNYSVKARKKISYFWYFHKENLLCIHLWFHIIFLFIYGKSNQRGNVNTCYDVCGGFLLSMTTSYTSVCCACLL